MSRGQEEDRRSSDRIPVSEEVEFYVDEDIVEATSIDVSESGIRLETPAPLNICMRIRGSGAHREHTARLVWSRTTDGGKMVYGFEYLPAPAVPGSGPAPAP